MPGVALALAASPAAQAGGAGGAAVPYYLVFNGSSSKVVCGSDTSLDDLHAAALTVEAWVRPDTADSWKGFVGKGLWSSVGWMMWVSAGSVGARVWASTATYSTSGAVLSVGEWAHVAMTYDNGGDRKHRLYVNGVLVSTSGAAVGSIVSDAAQSLQIGKNDSNAFNGAIGWVRISDTVRYTTNFTPDARLAPPVVDGNTVEQWNMDEGTGTTVAAQVSSPTNDGAITDGTWVAG